MSKDKIQSVIQDNSDNIKNISNVVDKFDGDKKRGSIIQSAKGNIFEFPVFVSNSVPLDYATAVNSLLEQVYASYLQMAISINPVVDSEVVRNGMQFGAFKTNTTKYLEHTDMSYAHDACHSIYNEDGYTLEFNMLSIEDSDAKVINEACDYQPLSEFDHYFVEAEHPNDHYTSRQYGPRGTTVSEPSEAEKQRMDWEADRDEKNEERAEAREQREVAKDKREFAKYKREVAKDKRDKDSHKLSKEKHNYDTKIKGPQFIDEGKIQKLNTMKPLLMSVNLSIMDKAGSISRPQEYIVGVKTHCRVVDSEILPEVAAYPIKEMDKLTRNAKWRAGELKFFKDIVFRIKQKKQTAIDSRDPKRKWYRRLYELAHMKGDSLAADISSGKSIKKILFKAFINDKTGQSSHGVIPNASLIITKSDVDNIKAETKIDLLKTSAAKQLCNELFLIGLVVIDNDAESVKILLPDLHDDFEIHSIASVNHQLSMLDTAGTKTRDMFKLLGR